MHVISSLNTRYLQNCNNYREKYWFPKLSNMAIGLEISFLKIYVFVEFS